KAVRGDPYGPVKGVLRLRSGTRSGNIRPVSPRATRSGRCPCGSPDARRGARRSPRRCGGCRSFSGASARWCGAWLPPPVRRAARSHGGSPFWRQFLIGPGVSVAPVTPGLSVAGVTVDRMTDDGDVTDPTGTDWDELAPTFDDEPDHGLRDPAV